MELANLIIGFLKKGKQKDEAPQGYCPNCWGTQEYEGKFFEAMKNNNVDLDNLKEKKGWIQAYALEHFETIKLKEEDKGLVCPSCKLTFSPT